MIQLVRKFIRLVSRHLIPGCRVRETEKDMNNRYHDAATSNVEAGADAPHLEIERKDAAGTKEEFAEYEDYSGEMSKAEIKNINDAAELERQTGTWVGIHREP